MTRAEEIFKEMQEKGTTLTKCITIPLEVVHKEYKFVPTIPKYTDKLDNEAREEYEEEGTVTIPGFCVDVGTIIIISDPDDETSGNEVLAEVV